MEFEFKNAIQILKRTPNTLTMLLSGLPGDWVEENEGENTWSPKEVVGHLILGEKTDWMNRAEIMLSSAQDKNFVPFDMSAHIEQSEGKTIDELLQQFADCRKSNISRLIAMDLQVEDFDKKGIHPEFGEVSLKQMLATWVAHDLGHIAQISKVMAKQYKEEVGPWIKYLGILK